MKNITMVFILWASSFCIAQSLKNPYVANIKQEATTMAKLMLNSNDENFSEQVFPSLIKKIKGDRGLIIMMRENIKFTKIKNITFEDPSPIIRHNNELQCTIKETMEIAVQTKKIIIKSTLIAISKDKGKRWYFIDANQSLKTLQQSLPNLSDSLFIPFPERPVIIN